MKRDTITLDYSKVIEIFEKNINNGEVMVSIAASGILSDGLS